MINELMNRVAARLIVNRYERQNNEQMMYHATSSLAKEIVTFIMVNQLQSPCKVTENHLDDGTLQLSICLNLVSDELYRAIETLGAEALLAFAEYKRIENRLK